MPGTGSYRRPTGKPTGTFLDAHSPRDPMDCDLYCYEEPPLSTATASPLEVSAYLDQVWAASPVIDVTALQCEETAQRLPGSYFAKLRHPRSRVTVHDRHMAAVWIDHTARSIGCAPNTAFLALELFDRLLARHDLNSTPDNLVRFLKVVCLSLAYKIEESACSARAPLPSLLAIRDGYFHADAVHLGERMVLQELDWRVNLVTPMSYLATVVSAGVNCWQPCLHAGDPNDPGHMSHVGEWLFATTRFYVSSMVFGEEGSSAPLCSMLVDVAAAMLYVANEQRTDILGSPIKNSEPRDGSASTNEKAFGAQSPALPYSIDGSVCFASLATHLQLPDVCLEMLAARLEVYVKRGNTKGWPTGAAVPSTPTTRARSSLELVDKLLAAQNNGSL